MQNHNFEFSSPGFFVGRHAEMNIISQSLLQNNSKVVMIVGPPGVGKTALAFAYANKFRDSFAGGVHNMHGNPMLSFVDTVEEVVATSARNSLVIIDDFDAFPDSDTASKLKELLHILPERNFILTSRVFLHHPIADATVSLSNLSSVETNELVRNVLGEDLAPDDSNKLFSLFQGSPLAVEMAGELLRSGITPNQLFHSLKPFEKKVILAPDGHALTLNDNAYKVIVSDFTSANRDFLQKLEDNPKLFYQLSSRQFEEVVAELLGRLGYKITLTPASKDGGKDIYAAKRDGLGSFLFVVECKKYAPDRPVGVGIIRQLHGVVQAERATGGIVATTSFFTKGAKEFQEKVPHQLSLRDYLGIQEWFKQS